jgi:subtilisin family serine protease
MGADVINLSWGGYGGGNQNLMNTVYNNYGCIIVASAGNGDEDGNTNFDLHTPSGLDNVISVSAVGPNDNFSCWATGGSTVDLCAPGESIMTTDVGNDYRSATGTSFASPITAGAVALLLSYFPNEDQGWIIDKLVSNTDFFLDMENSCDAGSLVGMLGSGRLNIYKALSSDVNASLSIIGVNYLDDTDGDGQFNPGEQTKIKLIIENEEGWADAENVIATISTTDERLSIIDSTISFSNTIVSGASSFTLVDHFLVSANAESSLQDVPCIVNLQSGISEPYLNIQAFIIIKSSWISNGKYNDKVFTNNYRFKW